MQKESNTVMNYLESLLSKLSVKTVYVILLLFYAYNSSSVPSWAKKIILGSLAYFVNPIDSIPDLTPFLGFTDDLGVLLFGLSTIACYVDDTVRQVASTKLSSIMRSSVDPEVLREVDSWL